MGVATTRPIQRISIKSGENRDSKSRRPLRPAAKPLRGMGARPNREVEAANKQQETLCIHSAEAVRPKSPVAEACKQSPPIPARTFDGHLG